MSFRSPTPLADDVVDRLFSRLSIRYGTPFLDRWRDLDLAVVKGDWARELSGFSSNLDAIAYGLDNLPEKPPTVIEFRRLCNGGPVGAQGPAIGHSIRTRSPDVAEREMLAYLRDSFAERRAGNTDWAHLVIARHQRGERVSSYELRIAREVVTGEAVRAMGTA